MEEDIKILKDTLNKMKKYNFIIQYKDIYFDGTDVSTIENILNRLEQLEKIIEEMATYIGKIDVSEDLCDDSICHEGDNCNECIIDHFRKKCE